MAERRVGLDSATNLPRALVMSLCAFVWFFFYVSPLCRQDYCFCVSRGASLGHDKRGLTSPSGACYSKPRCLPQNLLFPFAHALILNPAANEKVFPNEFWHVAPGKHQTPREPAALVRRYPLQGGIETSHPAPKGGGSFKEHPSVPLGFYNPAARLTGWS